MLLFWNISLMYQGQSSFFTLYMRITMPCSRLFFNVGVRARTTDCRQGPIECLPSKVLSQLSLKLLWYWVNLLLLVFFYFRGLWVNFRLSPVDENHYYWYQEGSQQYSPRHVECVDIAPCIIRYQGWKKRTKNILRNALERSLERAVVSSEIYCFSHVVKDWWVDISTNINIKKCQNCLTQQLLWYSTKSKSSVKLIMLMPLPWHVGV